MFGILFGIALGAGGYWAWQSFGKDLLGMGGDQGYGSSTYGDGSTGYGSSSTTSGGASTGASMTSPSESNASASSGTAAQQPAGE